MAEREKSQFIRPPNTLQAKVTIGGPRAVSPETLDRAERVVANLADEYMKWVADDLMKLQAAFERLRARDGETKDNLRAVFEIAHEIKGQGGSFDFPLMTRIGGQLCAFLEGLGEASDDQIEAIRLHVEALRLVIAQNLKGEGGGAGDELVRGLQKVIAKVHP